MVRSFYATHVKTCVLSPDKHCGILLKVLRSTNEQFMSIVEDIIRLKEEKNAVILAHYYVDEEVQDIADYIGDSFYLSKVATKTVLTASSFVVLSLWERVPRS